MNLAWKPIIGIWKANFTNVETGEEKIAFITLHPRDDGTAQYFLSESESAPGELIRDRSTSVPVATFRQARHAATWRLARKGYTLFTDHPPATQAIDDKNK